MASEKSLQLAESSGHRWPQPRSLPPLSDTGGSSLYSLQGKFCTCQKINEDREGFMNPTPNSHEDLELMDFGVGRVGFLKGVVPSRLTTLE